MATTGGTRRVVAARLLERRRVHATVDPSAACADGDDCPVAQGLDPLRAVHGRRPIAQVLDRRRAQPELQVAVVPEAHAAAVAQQHEAVRVAARRLRRGRLQWRQPDGLVGARQLRIAHAELP
eukprot:5023448-Prymnesium_polylepis.1